MIVIQTQLSSEHFSAVRAAIRERYPAIVGQVQVINSAGQFRLVPVRGGTMPAGLTLGVVESMISRTQPADNHTPLWAGPTNRRYARRLHR